MVGVQNWTTNLKINFTAVTMMGNLPFLIHNFKILSSIEQFYCSIFESRFQYLYYCVIEYWSSKLDNQSKNPFYNLNNYG